MLVKKSQKQGNKDVVDPNSSLPMHKALNASFKQVAVSYTGVNGLATSMKLTNDQNQKPDANNVQEQCKTADPHNENKTEANNNNVSISSTNNNGHIVSKEAKTVGTPQSDLSFNFQPELKNGQQKNSYLTHYDENAAKLKANARKEDNASSYKATPKSHSVKEEHRLSTRAQDPVNLKVLKYSIIQLLQLELISNTCCLRS